MPAFPTGFSGTELLERMREQAQHYGAKIVDGMRHQARARRGQRPVRRATWGSGRVEARTVLLATGVTNRRPPMDEALHDDALAARPDPLLPDLRRL